MMPAMVVMMMIAMVATVIPAIPVMIAMMTPMHIGGHLSRSKLCIILNRGGRAGIDEGHRVRVLGWHGQNQQRAGCGEPQKFRHSHQDVSFG